jgi:hypothetical protein
MKEVIWVTYLFGLMGVFGFLEGHDFRSDTGWKGAICSLVVAISWPIVVGSAIVYAACLNIARACGK